MIRLQRHGRQRGSTAPDALTAGGRRWSEATWQPRHPEGFLWYECFGAVRGRGMGASGNNGDTKRPKFFSLSLWARSCSHDPRSELDADCQEAPLSSGPSYQARHPTEDHGGEGGRDSGKLTSTTLRSSSHRALDAGLSSIRLSPRHQGRTYE